VVEVKTGSRSTAHWSTHFIRLNGWLRNSFTQLITPLDIDGIGQNWEDSNNACQGMSSFVLITNMCGAGMFLRSKPSQASGALTLFLNPKIEPNLTPTNPESVGYRGVAFTDDPGTSLPGRHDMATLEGDPLAATSTVGLPRSVSCDLLNEAWT